MIGFQNGGDQWRFWCCYGVILSIPDKETERYLAVNVCGGKYEFEG